MMKEFSEKIIQEAKRLLEQKEVDAFIGFTKGSLPMTTRPFVARSPQDAEKLIFNSFCVMNLARYLPEVLKSLEPPRKPQDPLPKGPLPKVGILATGCWSRNIVVQIQENQIDRDRVVIVGIKAAGMIDKRKVFAHIGEKEINSVEEQQDRIIVKGPGYEVKIAKEEVLRDNCQVCVHFNPVIYDILLEAPGAHDRQPKLDRFKQIEEIESLSSDERWAWFTKEIESCIRCYACRNACPLCYCPTCFVDDSRPQWVGKSIDPTDTQLFHILRAFHMAGRCTDCGACESACPMGIKMRLLTKKIEKDCLNLFNTEAGLSIDILPALSTYRPDDPQDFFISEELFSKDAK